MSGLAPTLQAFFTDRLARQRQASSHTIASYRDAFRLLLVFVEQQTAKPPAALEIADLDAPVIGAFLNHLEATRGNSVRTRNARWFLNHLEATRGNSVRTRNARLAAIHSLFRYAALSHPEDAAVIQRVLAIPPKRFARALITYLTEEEIDALLAAPTGRPGPAGATTPC